MKIGEFARKYNVSKNTVRYYVEHGLLIPESGLQYQFGKQEEEDMEMILRMKAQFFSLKEIATMLSICHTSNMIEPYTIQDCISILEQKRVELDQQINERKRAIGQIAEDIKKLSKSAGGMGSPIGVPISALELFVCPVCGKPLKLSEAVLDAQSIFEGKLFCSCGYTCQILDGILRTGNLYSGGRDSPDLTRGLYRGGGDAFVVQIKKMQDFVRKELTEMNMHGKVVLETHINGYFFAYNHLDSIPEDCLYIVTDKFPEMLEMYKKLIEMLPIKRRILFVADADTRLPVRRNSVDVLVACMSDTENSFYSKKPYIQVVSPYLKENAVICGSLLGYRGCSRSQRLMHEKYPEGCEFPACIDSFLQEYREAGYHIQKELLGVTKHTEKNNYSFTCHVPGECLSLYSFHADKG